MSFQVFLDQPHVKTLIEHLQSAQLEARFVGGCVRDALLGKSPYDIDLATPSPPDEIMQKLRKVAIKTYQVGRQHCTVVAPIEGRHVEITTLREDIVTDGRHAVVKFSNEWQLDAARRDFTINALYADFDGTIHDYHDGLSDLRAGHVRFIGDADARIAEDYLRILRFLRFSARFAKGGIDEKGLKACIAAHKSLARLSRERIRQEFLGLCDQPYRHDIWQILITHKFMEYILPGLDEQAILRLRYWHEQSLEEPLSQFLSLGALLWNNPCAKSLLEGLRLSKAMVKKILEILSAKPENFAPPMRALAHFHDLATASLALQAQVLADTISSDHASTIRDDWRERGELPKFPLSGDDYNKAGIAKGVATGVIERTMRDWWLSTNATADRDRCLQQLTVFVKEG
ncbi:MAG: CCA tRNA nucleotidyltransferase [Pseudomonadota bacterium]